MKKYQDCSKLVKLYRRRCYARIPFEFIWYSVVGFEVLDTDVERYYYIKGKELWKMLVSIAQLDMRWVFEMKDVKDLINKR